MYNHRDLSRRLVLIDDLICILDGTGRREEAIDILAQLKEVILEHFDYEERCVFMPVLSAIRIEQTILTILQLVREHGEMESVLAELSSMLAQVNGNLTAGIENQIIEVLLGVLKPKIVTHAGLEERVIVPQIKQNSAVRHRMRGAIQKFQ